MSDPLAHVGPSEHYLRGYNAALGCGDDDGPRVNADTIHSVAYREFEEGWMDGKNDIAAGCVLGGAIVNRDILF